VDAVLRVPGYLPEIARPLTFWAKRHCIQVSRRYHAPVTDLWDEALTALLRASLHYSSEIGPFAPYARTAIHRACWRYGIRGKYDRESVQLSLESLELAEDGHYGEHFPMLTVWSPEDALIAQESLAPLDVVCPRVPPTTSCGSRRATTTSCGRRRATPQPVVACKAKG